MDKKIADEIWYWYLVGDWRVPPPRWLARGQQFFNGIYKFIPGSPHCFECGVPMAGIGGTLLRFMGSRPSSFSSRLCSNCEKHARQQESGAEVDLTMLFADVRDSTPLAESQGTKRFQELIGRFYKETSHVLVEHNAMVNRLMGDQVIALFVPRFAGKDHAKVALHAARELLHVTGHENPNGPWIPVGIGIHTGMAYVGAVGSKDGVNEIAVLGSAANLCARLSSKAAAGEILVSEDAIKSGGLDPQGLEDRHLELKGVSQPVSVGVIHITSINSPL
ncbi:MAG TPA: adenylate/guanylate cyclase domain-containing protein [Anaerolineales bacterium]|nr:adenylate/guanylate cyclase domain-containing protein [Anaerolineales bacterium]